MVRRIRPRFVLVLSLILWTAAHAQSGTLALVGGTVIDGAGRGSQPDAVVVVRNGWITAVGPRSAVPVPRGAQIVDVSGKFLVPGFIEMHGHLALGVWELDTIAGKPALRYAYDEEATQELTRSQLAFGITTVRSPAAPTREGLSLRNRVRTGELIGPRILTSGSVLDRPTANTATIPITTEAEARAAVAAQAAAGVDLIKVYDGLDSALVRAAIDDAHRHGLLTVGHLASTSWTDAALAGIDAITHVIVSNAKLLPPDRRAEFLAIKHRGLVMFDWFRFADFDGPEIQDLLRTLVLRHVSIDPTLSYFESVAWYDQPSFYPREAEQYVPPTFAAKEKAMNALRGWSATDYAKARDRLPRMQELVRRLHQAGVPLTVGTDAANPWMFHREMELLAASGIPNADVLRMATRNAAVALRLGAELGTIEVGKRADLVVLDADPLVQIFNTRRIAQVMHGGVLTRPAAHLPERLRKSR